MTATLASLAEQGSLRLLTDRLLQSVLFWAMLCLFAGVWLLLPRHRQWGRWLGGLLALVGLALFGAGLRRLSEPTQDGLFVLLAGVTVVACIATVTARNPVYSAIWFALALLGVGALMMFQGAQLLAVATVVVYAGAIVVTLLFVLMLAQPEGRAPYDRLSWKALLSAAVAALFVGMLTVSVVRGLGALVADKPTETAAAVRAELAADLLAPEHTARLGAQLFGRHLVAVEVAGVLLLVALVGAVAIVEQGRRGPAASGQDSGEETLT